MGKATIVGVDVGGTFTDLIAVDEVTGQIAIAKVPTTVKNQAEGFLTALAQSGIVPDSVKLIIHGTTTATNALIERKGAVVGLITTRGFRDVLELRRRTRPKAYGLTGSFEPLIPRHLRVEVDERMDAEGEVVTPLQEDQVREASALLRSLGVEAIVIHFLHSYINTRHEQRAAELVSRDWRYVTAGSALLPEYREYERGCTAAINAYVQPIIDRYLNRLSDELRVKGYGPDLLIMQGNGGMMSVPAAVDQAVNTLLSGPAAGVKAAAYVCARRGYSDVITCDMGGTSFDVAVIRNGKPESSVDKELDYALPVRVPMIDIHTIGAGGGSIASVNSAGILQVGPDSAGAEPGPICYGRGGEEPTTTDANLLLGRLSPDRLLGVTARIDLDLVSERITQRLGVPLGLTPVAAAAAIIKVANDKMAGAIRMVSVERGYDPRDFILFAFGGAGPLHAAALARELAIPKVLVPARPGITSALGCVVADLRHDFVKTINQNLSQFDLAAAHGIFGTHVDEGRRRLAAEGIDIAKVVIIHEADMQYLGQHHVLTVPLQRNQFGRDELLAAFEKAYHERFDVELEHMQLVVVSLRTTVVGHRPLSLNLASGDSRAGATNADVRKRSVWFDDGWHDTPVYQRDALAPGTEFIGPAIVEQLDATTVIEPGDLAHIDSDGNIEITVRP